MEISVQMNGGDGLYSYSHNSSYQRKAVDAAKKFISEGISEKFDIKQVSAGSSPTTATFCIADLGCSVGPNTFIAMQNIIDGIRHKYKSQGHIDPKTPEFQVFFNDHISNDFNKLFTSFPLYKQYYAAAVPGSFSTRLFPKASLHFVHSSTAIQWLSKVPKQVKDVNSTALNKGRIHCGGAPREVIDAYSSQFRSDMDSFFSARAEELVSGALMALTIPTTPKNRVFPHPIDVLGSCMLEMAKNGQLSEEKVDSFNIPVYIPFAEEFEEAIKNNGCFSIERFELLDIPINKFDSKILGMHVRAVWEGLISEHFGNEIMDDLFLLFAERAEDIYKSAFRFDADLFVLLKRK
ncbi:gibberellin A4 carboxyl methyltransferase [Ranunculus cassubicifolius]